METVVPHTWKIFAWGGEARIFHNLAYERSFFIVQRNFQDTTYISGGGNIAIRTDNGGMVSYQINSDPWWDH